MFGQFPGSADDRNPKPGGGLKSVCCQVCGTEIALVHDDEIAKRLESGEYVNRRVTSSKQWGGGTSYDQQEGYFGLCSKCRREEAATLDLRGAEVSTRAQAARIQERIRYIRLNWPGISIEEAATRATEDEFEPHNEPRVASMNGARRSSASYVKRVAHV